MENKETLPHFNDVNAALRSGAPFRLRWHTNFSGINLGEMTDDQLLLLQNAFLHENVLHWTIKSQLDLKFLINVLAAHNGVDMLQLTMHKSIDFDDNMVTVFQSSKVKSIRIKKTADNADAVQVLRLLQYHNNLQNLTLAFAPTTSEYEALACAVANEHLEDFGSIATTDLGPWHTLQPVISQHKSLKSLSLCCSSPIGHLLGEIFSTNKSIRRLTLYDYNDKTESDWNALGSGLINNTTLRKITLIEGATANLFNLVAINRCPVPKLSFEAARFTENDLKVLGAALKTNTTVRELHFNDSDFTADSQLWQDVLIQNKSLKRLLLFYCQVNIDCMKALCTGLANSSSSLNELLLSGCETTDDQCQLIAQMLTKNKSLSELHVESSDYSDTGLVHICEAVASNTTLQRLFLGHHENGVEGMTGVKSMLVRNKTLRQLKISIDYGSEEAIDILCDGLKHNAHLTHLIFGEFFPIDDAMEQMFIAALQDNYALDTIDFGRDNDTRQTLQGVKVQELTQRNRSLKSQVKFKIAILSHNIARSREALTTLPREIWIGVLSMVTHPGLESFESFVRTIFDSYMHK